MRTRRYYVYFEDAFLHWLDTYAGLMSPRRGFATPREAGTDRASARGRQSRLRADPNRARRVPCTSVQSVFRPRWA